MLLSNPRPDAPTTDARDLLDAQSATARRHFGVSLDALWRGVGSPADESPADWVELARPVVLAFAGYRRRLHQATAHERPGEFVALEPTWTLDRRTMGVVVAAAGGPGSLEVGDLMAFEELAELYAGFLDHRGLRRNLTRSGARELNGHHERTAASPRFAATEPRPGQPEPAGA